MTQRLLMALAFLLAAVTLRAETLLIQAEQLQLPGNWQVTRGQPGAKRFIWSGTEAGGAPAVGAVDVPHTGTWRLWVRSRDFAKDRPGIRHFTVRLGPKRSERKFGTHAQEGIGGWEWEDGRTFELDQGPILLVVGDQAEGYARCDALVLTDDLNYHPKGMPRQLRIPAAKMAPLDVKQVRSATPQSARHVDRVSQAPVAELRSQGARWTFHQAETSAGSVIATKAMAADRSDWRALDADPSDESYHVIFCEEGRDPGLPERNCVLPTWATALCPDVEVSLAGASARTRLAQAHTPWQAGQHYGMRPTTAKQLDPQTVELAFEEMPFGRLRATWRAVPGLPAAQVTLTFDATQPGQVTLGYHGALAAKVAEGEFHLLPFMYHGHRMPDQPQFVLDSHTPTPIALVNRGGLSYALVAEPKDIPFQWPNRESVRFALAIRNERGLAQPMLYSPVLGRPQSHVEPGKRLAARFYVWLQPGDWYAAFKRVATQLFGVHDYRRPTQCSLSDAALNLFDLLRDEDAAGWDARSKAPWNIERRNMTVHASPLTYMSYYLLTGDQAFYERCARPALEALLSRTSPFFTATAEATRLGGPVRLYGATTYAGAFAMTQGRSPALADFILDDQGLPRHTRGYGHSMAFEDALAVHRLTGDAKWLDLAVAGGREYVDQRVRRLPTGDLGTVPFVNLSFVLDWEGLLHLAEATGDRAVADASADCAKWLLTTLWTQPLIPQGDITIHPGGRCIHSLHIWWRGDRRFKLGIVEREFDHEKIYAQDVLPTTRLPERKVAAWKTSNVGLGLEQPCTYTRREANANILMSTWAPNMLRLAALTGDDFFRTAARNATIGRFGNYPGYYVQNFTDQYHRPDYPLTGPDITCIYYHHVPPFAAYVLDYLFTDAEMRSAGRVAFPWVRQHGYAWFDCRLRGHAPGQVYGHEAWPWLHRTAASVDTVNVDRVLAHGDGKFHVLLLNQVREPQRVQVTFDERVLGRKVDGARVEAVLDNEPARSLTVAGRSVSLELPALGIAALTLDRVKIDVPTHRTRPARHFALPSEPGTTKAGLDGAGCEARASWIAAPPFDHRDLYVYLAASAAQCQDATLHYRVGTAAERAVVCERFPFEFTVRVADPAAPVTWSVEAALPDGKRVQTAPVTMP